jgi:hypothetical protein
MNHQVADEGCGNEVENPTFQEFLGEFFFSH